MIVASMSSWGSSLREVNVKRRMCELSAGWGEFGRLKLVFIYKTQHERKSSGYSWTCHVIFEYKFPISVIGLMTMKVE